MSYVDPDTVHNPATGTVAPAAWGDVIRDDLEFLIDPPACSVFDNTGQSVADNTLATLNANSENFDNDAMHSTVTNNSRITVQTAGRYEFTSRVQFGTSGTGRRTITYRLNGTTSTTVASAAAVSGAAQTVPSFFKIVMGVGDYIEVQVFQTSGGSLTVTLVEFTGLFITR